MRNEETSRLSFRHRHLSLFRLHLVSLHPSVDSRAIDRARTARTAATMKFAIFSFLSIASLATAQLEDVPECAVRSLSPRSPPWSLANRSNRNPASKTTPPATK